MPRRPLPRRPGRPRIHTDKRAAQAAASRAYRRRKRRSVHHKSNSSEWYTPRDLIDRVLASIDRAGGQFDLDPCAPPGGGTVPAARYYTREDDGLLLPWTGLVFVNPPYGRQIAAWTDKAIAEAARGAHIILLVPARVDTSWWHRLMEAGGRPEFIRGRIRFGGPNGTRHSAPFPSALVVLPG